MRKKIIRVLRQMQGFADRWWYQPLVGLLAGLDLFVMVIPTDGLLISAVLLQPRHWVRALAWTTLGSSLGALGLAALLRADSGWVLNHLFAGALQSENWIRIEQFVADHGRWALAVLALSPLPQQPSVIVASLAHMPLYEILFAFGVGRLIKYTALCWIASHTPRYLMKIPILQQELVTLQESDKEAEKNFPARNLPS